MNIDDDILAEAFEGDAESREFVLTSGFEGLKDSDVDVWLKEAVERQEESLVFGIANWFGDVRQNQKRCLEVSEIASRLGNATASFTLGDAYREGSSVDRDFAKAHSYYRLAAKQGYDYSEGCSPLWGGDDRSEVELRKEFGDEWAEYVIRADERVDANPEALDHDPLNGCYVSAAHEELLRLEEVAEQEHDRMTVEQLRKKEVDLIEEAVMANDPLAKFQLAIMCLNGSCGVKQDRARGKLLLLQARASGVRRASSMLASCFPEDKDGSIGLHNFVRGRARNVDWMFPNGHDDGE